MTEKIYSSIFAKSRFVSLVLSKSLPLQMKYLHNKHLDEERELSPIEKINSEYLLPILNIFFTINTYLRELIDIPEYINVDSNKLKLLYGNKISEDQYFVYHYDNIVMRLIISVDLCAKMGNLVYRLNIPEKECSCYKFIGNSKVKSTESVKELQSFLEQISHLKNYRNQKMHHFKTNEQNLYEAIIFDWDKINKIGNIQSEFAAETLNYLKEQSNNDILNARKQIKRDITIVIKNTMLFLDTLTDCLEGNIK